MSIKTDPKLDPKIAPPSDFTEAEGTESYTPSPLEIARGNLSDYAAGALDIGDENKHRANLILVLNTLEMLAQRFDDMHHAAVELVWALERVQISGKGSDVVSLGTRLDDLNECIRPSV